MTFPTHINTSIFIHLPQNIQTCPYHKLLLIANACDNVLKIIDSPLYFKSVICMSLIYNELGSFLH
jgi:hypothetical protein